MSFELGRTYSDYEFLDVVKKTNTTVAYRVRNRKAGREELLYFVPEAGRDDAQQRERFLREMNLRARLSHPGIPAFLDVTELDGHLVMTTEFVEGRTLADLLQAGPMPWQEAAALAKQVLSALACAHELNIIHRDISPENIIVTGGDGVKLSNFGLAKGISSPQLTQAGVRLGNTRYMSPEQARGTGELDCRSDIYSLGAVLYHMLCGRPPFVAASEFEVIVAHVKQAPQPPSAVHAAVPAALDAVVLKALAKEPGERFATCAEFAAALESRGVVPEEAPKAAVPVRAGRPWTLVGGAAAGLAVVLLAIWYIAHA
jgi:serine/threonine-protein kinase